jgi:hypothetical protein
VNHKIHLSKSFPRSRRAAEPPDNLTGEQRGWGIRSSWCRIPERGAIVNGILSGLTLFLTVALALAAGIGISFLCAKAIFRSLMRAHESPLARVPFSSAEVGGD